ncbi:glucosamine-6-phosphate deaminase [Gemelliphila asaccharolytica]|uniref:Glucosamine-6-phosphate deaminase n=1 Tax=Gemelliphila asaccharolytica TaxID=502393 RepID=A0ABR5TKM2_9BACL|nr:glucosamine-6-phosphate deaminase [Gemella asaccharolytica]KXB56299.1 putative glucosamine-6-phosphate deaminase [Gemella asaccharolytica]
MNYYVFKNKEEASKKAFELLKKYLTPTSTLGLATGSSPTALYKEMIKYYKDGFSYQNIETFNLDEYVAIDYNHKQSYHYFMNHHLFNHIDIKKENIHIPDASNKNLKKAIENYQNLLDNRQIDVQILGVGSNGHIGFNEPFTSFSTGVHKVNLNKETIKANSRFFDNDESLVPKYAVTMGIKDIMKAKIIILLAFGESKKNAIKKLLSDYEVTEEIPCTVLKQHPNVHIFVDEKANYKN